MRLCFFFLKKIINIFKDSGIGIFTNSVNYNQYLNPNIFFSLKKMGVLRILTRFNEKFERKILNCDFPKNGYSKLRSFEVHVSSFKNGES
jgi:hypothetical protein